ncbi:unnamed protein product [Chondrus crispus]|uniref:Uncharacterized protein n=1 Tax=Chondrus crispus TaxID=2769 RepID=R7QH38_CHOCR|nr:unnamed protein product [Chondrus crispus]CDF37389.1 unnamed protein product [Chondrus crispus]|eukprot:XP_005717208.1 unnamed protein product [Chondrus crispus]
MQSDKPILDVKKFLSRKIVDNSKSKTVLSVIVQAHSRAIEAIRIHFVCSAQSYIQRLCITPATTAHHYTSIEFP